MYKKIVSQASLTGLVTLEDVKRQCRVFTSLGRLPAVTHTCLHRDGAELHWQDAHTGLCYRRGA